MSMNLLKTMRTTLGLCVIAALLFITFISIYNQGDKNKKESLEEIGDTYKIFEDIEGNNNSSTRTSLKTKENVDQITKFDIRKKEVIPWITDHTKGKPNVLFIVSDDLRPQINSYNGPYSPNPFNNFKMHTPNLDALAHRSLQMNRAYVQFGICSPSRTSYMTGRRPDTTRVWDLRTHWRNSGGNFTSIPQFFKENGYRTIGMGKIYHPGSTSHGNDPLSWSERYYHDSNGLFYQRINMSWWAVPTDLVKQKPLPDQEITETAIKFMAEHKTSSRKEPFFLAVGFQKPHIPFVFPEEYLKYYPLEDMDIASNPYAPSIFPKVAWFHFESRKYEDFKAYNVTGKYKESLPDTIAKLQRRAYFACVTFVDDMVGRLTKAVEDLELDGSTIISFIGDHGYHLGENGMWGKHTNLEHSTRAPLLLRIPRRTDRGIQSDSLVEFIDLFPTLAEAAGLGKLPECPPDSSDVLLCTEGKSFLRLVEQPHEAFRDRAISQMNRYGAVGYTVRTKHFRYVEWGTINKTVISYNRCTYEIKWERKYNLGKELYDHRNDPEENVNVVDNVDYLSKASDFSSQIREFVEPMFVSNCNQV